MSDSQKRLEKSGEKVPFDAAAIGLRIGAVDRANLARDPEGPRSYSVVEMRAFAMLVRAVVAAAFEGGMARRDGKTWAAWQDILDDEIPARPVTRGQAEWLAKHVNGDEVKTPAPLAQWRESVGEYLADLALGKQIEQNGADPHSAQHSAPASKPST